MAFYWYETYFPVSAAFCYFCRVLLFLSRFAIFAIVLKVRFSMSGGWRVFLIFLFVVFPDYRDSSMPDSALDVSKTSTHPALSPVTTNMPPVTSRPLSASSSISGKNVPWDTKLFVQKFQNVPYNPSLLAPSLCLFWTCLSLPIYCYQNTG